MIRQDYSKYKHFGFLTKMPENVLQNLSDHYDHVTSKKHPGLFQSGYIQWMIQTANKVDVDRDFVWTHWTDNDQLSVTKKFFNNFVKSIIRFRYSLLFKNCELDYHGKHRLPRIHIPLDDSNGQFVIRDENGEHFYSLEYGNAYFINVTLDHKVIPTKPVTRKQCFFSFAEFVNDEISDQFKIKA